MSPDALESLPHVKKWLGYSKAAVDIVDSLAPDATEEDRMKLLIEQNVLLQLQHLRTHPAVAAALAKGTTELHGWVYDIRSGEVEAFDEAENRFITVDTRYAAQIKELAGQHTCAA